MPFKNFLDGDILPGDEINDYLMNQTLMRFDDAAARAAALTGVESEGMTTYLDDQNVIELYDGNGWFPTAGKTVVKGADVTRTSTSTVADDSGTTPLAGIALPANASYKVKAVLYFGSTSGTPDFKCGWTLPAAATGFRACVGPQIATADVTVNSVRTSVHAWATDVPYGTITTGPAGVIVEEGVLVVTTAGNLTLQWAQNTSSGTGTTLFGSSFVTAERVPS